MKGSHSGLSWAFWSRVPSKTCRTRATPGPGLKNTMKVILLSICWICLSEGVLLTTWLEDLVNGAAELHPMIPKGVSRILSALFIPIMSGWITGKPCGVMWYSSTAPQTNSSKITIKLIKHQSKTCCIGQCFRALLLYVVINHGEQYHPQFQIWSCLAPKSKIAWFAAGRSAHEVQC